MELEAPPGGLEGEGVGIGLENSVSLVSGSSHGKARAICMKLTSIVMEYPNTGWKMTAFRLHYLLTTGARVIEYIVKSRNDNVFFKLWPDKASDDKRVFRKRGYYPYGGFEDFLGQGSMETHKVYNEKYLKKKAIT